MIDIIYHIHIYPGQKSFFQIVCCTPEFQLMVFSIKADYIQAKRLHPSTYRRSANKRAIWPIVSENIVFRFFAYSDRVSKYLSNDVFKLSRFALNPEIIPSNQRALSPNCVISAIKRAISRAPLFHSQSEADFGK